LTSLFLNPLGLRQQPAMDLRKTCKVLKPFLPSDKQEQFQTSYQIMIDAVNEMDVVSGVNKIINRQLFLKLYTWNN
jgi:hypothetical protein